MTEVIGSGRKFRKLAGQLSRPGVQNPQALAAAIGRRKYGAKRMAALAAAGRRRAATATEPGAPVPAGKRVKL